MRPSRTAKDDQPGPTGRRHSSTGGDADQLVSIRTPGMTPSRWGPRKPGQSALIVAAGGAGSCAAGSLREIFAAAGTGKIAVDSTPARATTGSAAGFTAAGGGGMAVGRPLAWTRSLSSAVAVQRHARSTPPPPVIPLVRKSAHPKHASRMVATIVARRAPPDSRRLATAHTTRAMPRIGMAHRGNMNPIIPVAIERSMMRDVANIAASTKTTAPQRSDPGARLKNAHHMTIANPPTTPPRAPNGKASGTTMGRTNLARHTINTRTTPGHSRSGFWGVGSPV